MLRTLEKNKDVPILKVIKSVVQGLLVVIKIPANIDSRNYRYVQGRNVLSYNLRLGR